MAKRGANRRKFNLQEVRVAAAVSAGALAALDLAQAAMVLASGDTYRLISCKLAYNWLDIQAAIDDGAQFGLSHSDYTDAEIEECLEAGTSMDLGNKVGQEQANRLVRQIGTIGNRAASGGGMAYRNGEMIHTKLNWLMAIGETLNLWVRNSSGTVWTTGSSLGATGSIWIKR